MNENRNDLVNTIAQVIEELKIEKGASFSIESINVAEVCRRTGLSRSKVRKLKSQGFKILGHGNKGINNTAI